MTPKTNPSQRKRLSHSRDYVALTFKPFVILFLVLQINTGFSQVLPSPKDCTSKDLVLVGASLEVDNICSPTPGSYPLYLSINNKTGSFRTSFALWGTLVVKNTEG